MELNENEMCKCGHIGSMHWQYQGGCAADKCKCKNREKITLRDRLDGIKQLWMLVLPVCLSIGVWWLFSFINPELGLAAGTIAFTLLLVAIINATGVF